MTGITDANRRVYRHTSLEYRLILAMLTAEEGEHRAAFDLIAAEVDHGGCCDSPTDRWRSLVFSLALQVADQEVESEGRDDAIAQTEWMIPYYFDV
jgi:hypothetical protein